MTTIIPAADAAQFLTLVPRLAGFHPARSLVLVPFRGHRTLGVLRVDLPNADADVDRVAATLIGMACKVREADGVAIVVYTDDGMFCDGAQRPGDMSASSLVRALIGRADACGLHITDALCVAADGWASYLDEAPEPRSLRELDDPEVIGRLPRGLREPLADQSAGASLPLVDADRVVSVAAALDDLEAAIDAVCGATGTEDAARGDLATVNPQALAAACALEDLPALFEDALDWDPATIGPFDAAALLWCMDRPALRDAALVQWCAGMEPGAQALAAQIRWEQGEPYPEHLAAWLWGQGQRPEAGRLSSALAVLRHAAALAPDHLRPGALAAAGWLCWALGRSTHAGWHAEKALATDPDHGLSAILLSMLDAGHLPEWAFADRADRRRPRAT